MSLIHFWSGLFAWFGVMYYVIDGIAYNRFPWHDSCWSKTITIKTRDKEWDE